MNRRFTAISISLNLVLFGVCLFYWKSSRSPAHPERQNGNQSASSLVIHRTNVVQEEEVKAFPGFHWREIESADYSTYIANLRKVNCPERTIINIVLADIEKLFEQRKKELDVAQKFWLTGNDFEKASRAKVEQKFQLQEEKRTLIRALLNTDLDWEALQAWYREDELGMLIGFLQDTQAELVVSVATSHFARVERVEDRADGFTIPEDAEENQRVFTEMKTAIGQIVSPAELEEIEMRLVVLLGYIFSGGNLQQSKLSGAELRHLTKLQLQTANPIQEELNDFVGKESAPQIAARQKFLREARKFLGENRFGQYLRAHDESFRQLCEMTGDNGLQLQIAMGVYEIQQAVLLESTQIREDNTLLRKEQRLELEAMARVTQESVQRLLGEKVAARYSTNGGHWLKEIENP